MDNHSLCVSQLATAMKNFTKLNSWLETSNLLLRTKPSTMHVCLPPGISSSWKNGILPNTNMKKKALTLGLSSYMLLSPCS